MVELVIPHEGLVAHGKPKPEQVSLRETAACGEPMLELRKRVRGEGAAEERNEKQVVAERKHCTTTFCGPCHLTEVNECNLQQ